MEPSRTRPPPEDRGAAPPDRTAPPGQAASGSEEETAGEHDVPIRALNRLGSFEWDLDRGRIRMDATALAVLGVSDENFDERPLTLGAQMPEEDSDRITDVVGKALRSGADSYGTYFRIRHGTDLNWAYAHGSISRDDTGRPLFVHGIVRDATEELHQPGRYPSGPPDGLRRRGDIVQQTVTALARAHTVQDVIDVLETTYDLERLGTASMLLGLVESGRIRIVAARPARRLLAGLETTRIEELLPTSEAVRTLQPVFIESPEAFAHAYPQLWERVSSYGITAAAFLPLIAQARPIGVLGLHYHDRTTFAQQERNLLLALAGSVAQSLQRAMFYDEAKDLAHSLQQAMLPRGLPAVPGTDVAVRYRSASLSREIGGDWYDLIPLPQGRYGAVIGDVQGHDTHAAAVMGQLRTVLRAYAAEGHPPATVLGRASVFLHELDTERFATCVYAQTDPASGETQVVRAGHLPPLVRLADGTCKQLDIPGGLPLGHAQEFDRPEYVTTTFELSPGQTLLLCTDGLVERPGTDVEEGLAALCAQVQDGPEDLEELADLLTAAPALDDRVGEDDVALLLLRRHRHGTASAAGVAVTRWHAVAPDDPGALAGARRMIRDAGRSLGAGARSDDIELVADELITNVLVHTEGPAAVTVRLLGGSDDGTEATADAPETTGATGGPEDTGRTGGDNGAFGNGDGNGGRRLRVEVEDSSSALPRRREASSSGMSGRGLLLVDELADKWGVEPRGAGKCVWSEFAVPPDPATD